MRDFTSYKSLEIHGKYSDRRSGIGVVYLMKCNKTGIFKLGASENPLQRFQMLRTIYKKKGLELQYVWSIATNWIRFLEPFWKHKWAAYRCRETSPFATEWFRIPESEVDEFRSHDVLLVGILPIPQMSQIGHLIGPLKPGDRRRKEFQ